jgi:hypothetical protein
MVQDAGLLFATDWSGDFPAANQLLAIAAQQQPVCSSALARSIASIAT